MSTDRSGSDEPVDKEAFLTDFRHPEHRTKQADGPHRRLTDADSIRTHFGIPPFDVGAFDKATLIPDIIQKTWDGGHTQTGGGTDLLTVGKPGSGKSTLANHLAVREIEVPESKVVWRGSASRSEWLPLAPWTVLCLPSGIEYEARFVPRNPSHTAISLTLDELEEHVVRGIRRYDTPRDLNQNLLDPGQVHVVYPDPEMRGLQDAYERSEEKQYDAPPDRPLFHESDPSTHWWFGWMLSRIEDGPHDWTTLILDEIGDIAPEAARKDQSGTYQKIQLLRDCWVDARKLGLTIYAFGHAERDIHNLIRHKIRWRTTMNGTANPTSSSSVVGFGAVPMDWDICSRMDIGEALVWNQQHFEKIAWSDYPDPVGHKLQLKRRS